MSEPADLAYTLKDLDQALGARKGTAFRRFKAALPDLREGQDFRVLDADESGALLEQLRHQRRIYTSSLRVIVLSGATYRRLLGAGCGHSD